MSGQIAVRYQVDGEPYFFGCLSESELAMALGWIGEHDPAPEVIPDGLADLRESLPVGARVAPGPRIHWKHQLGTIVETCEMPGCAHWPEDGPAAHMLTHEGVSVCVKFDGEDYSSWWRASWFERVS